MGELSEALDEFKDISKVHYNKIQQILKDKYCWKCPMRSTSKSTSCRDIDAWIRLTGAFEKGISEHLLLNDQASHIEAITSRYIFKIIKKHSNHLKYDKVSLLKLKEDIEPYVKKDEILVIDENPESIKEGDLILWPQICPVSFLWFSKLKLTSYIPFNILKVSKTFHRNGCRYILFENMEIPLEFVQGKITRIIDKDDPFCDMFL